MHKLKVRVLRTLLVGGVRHEAGEVLELRGEDAIACVGSTRAELVSGDLLEAVHVVTEQAMREAGPVSRALAGDPWQAVAAPRYGGLTARH